MIFITGASGFIGTNLVKKLVKKGYKVTCFVRKTSNISNFTKLSVNIKYGDMANQESISKALNKSDIVVHLAAITSEVSSDYRLSRKINVEGTRNLLKACKKNKIKKIINLTSESTKRKIKGVYARTKAEADELIKNSGVPYTILRPSIVYGAGSRGLFKKTLEYIENLPLVPIIGSGKQKLIPIHVDDVTDAILSSIESKKTINKEYDLTGADKLSFNQFIDQILDELNIKKKKIRIPFHMVYLGAKVLSIFMKNPPVTTDNLLGLKQEVSMSYVDAKKDFNFNPLTFKQGLKRTFYDFKFDKNKRNIAIVGFGKMGLLHASIVNQIPNANLAAIMDRNPKVKKQLFGLGIDVPFFTSVDKMLENMKLDGVFICVPPYLNFELSKKFVDKGISVFVEKPLANNLENATKMVKITDRKKISTSCGYMVAYFPIFRELKNIMKNRKFGKVKSFESYCYVSQVFKHKSPKSVWQYDPKKTGGGVLITMASHLIFLLEWYFGQCSSVRGSSKSIYTVMDDEVTVKLNFEKDITGTIGASWSIKEYENLTWIIKIVTEKSHIKATNRLITIKDKKNNKIDEIHVSDIEDNSKLELGGQGYYNQNLDFIGCIGNNRKPLTNWKDSLKTQQIIDAIYKSIKTDREIKL